MEDESSPYYLISVVSCAIIVATSFSFESPGISP